MTVIYINFCPHILILTRAHKVQTDTWKFSRWLHKLHAIYSVTSLTFLFRLFFLLLLACLKPLWICDCLNFQRGSKEKSKYMPKNRNQPIGDVFLNFHCSMVNVRKTHAVRTWWKKHQMFQSAEDNLRACKTAIYDASEWTVYIKIVIFAIHSVTNWNLFLNMSNKRDILIHSNIFFSDADGK